MSTFAIAVLVYAADSKLHEELEAREFNPETCERMRNNWDRHAEAWCSGSGGVDWNNTDRTCKKVSDHPTFTKVTGKITCNKTSKVDNTPSSIPSKCEIKNILSLGYQGGSKHQFCLDNGYTGGYIPNNARAGHCWRGDCPRISLFYNCIGTGGSRCCDHLTHKDACKLKVCGYK